MKLLREIKRIRIKSKYNPIQLMSKLFKRKERFNYTFVALDIETTGTDKMDSDIYEVGMVLIKNGKVKKEFQTFIYSETISRNIMFKRSLTLEYLEFLPDYKEAYKAIRKFCKKYPIVAHNSRFDSSFITYKSLQHTGKDFDNPWVDTLALARKILPYLRDHKLDTLANHYKIDNKFHHQALNDARVCADLMLCLMGHKPVATKTSIFSRKKIKGV